MRSDPKMSSATRWLSTLPDLLLALLFLAIGLDHWLGEPLTIWCLNHGWRPLDGNHPGIQTLLVLEVVFLVPQLTLVDVATRLKARPPWWLVLPMTIALLLLAPGGMDALRLLAANQSWLLMPALWSVAQRAYILWTIPGRPDLERMRLRAQAGGRANIGGMCLIAALALSFLRTSGPPGLFEVVRMEDCLSLLIALYFSLCAFDCWRLRGERFARNPTPFLWWDYVGVKDHNVPL